MYGKNDVVNGRKFTLETIEDNFILSRGVVTISVVYCNRLRRITKKISFTLSNFHQNSKIYSPSFCRH